MLNNKLILFPNLDLILSLDLTLKPRRVFQRMSLPPRECSSAGVDGDQGLLQVKRVKSAGRRDRGPVTKLRCPVTEAENIITDYSKSLNFICHLISASPFSISGLISLKRPLIQSMNSLAFL